MKLCNDCDLNYRASKNKRLLVELTLIQCAQLTLPDADDASGGRGPKKILKPLFTQQAASTAATQPQPQAKAAAAQTAATAVPQPQGTSTTGSMNASRPSPLPQTREEKKIPVFKAGSLGISLRRPLHEQQAAEKQDAKVVIKFTVNTAGKLEKFQILESPKEKAFEQAVISLLKESPQWAPAELTDGTKVNMEFTLPVSFKPEK